MGGWEDVVLLLLNNNNNNCCWNLPLLIIIVVQFGYCYGPMRLKRLKYTGMKVIVWLVGW